MIPLPDESHAQHSVLYVDDELKALQYFVEAFEDEFPIYTAANAADAFAILQSRGQEIGVLITDQRMPGEQGVDLLEKARKLNPNLVRILVTAYSDYQTVVDAVNSGRVFRYLHKPWNPDEMLSVVRHALEYYSALVEREELLNLKGEAIRQMQMADKVGSIGILAEGLNHHLRNALTAIRAFVDLSPTGADTTFSGQSAHDHALWLEFRKHAQGQLDRIYSLLSHIGQASKPGRTARETAIDVAGEITKVFAMFDHAYSQKHVTVFLDLDPETPQLQVSHERFQQLLRLLFTEEMTHLSPGDELVISVTTAENHSGQQVVRICFRDNGDWPAQERFANFFDPFFVRSKKPDDFGVNMMACYSIVYQHGGTIEAKSGQLSGVEITMDFPLEQRTAPDAADFFQRLIDHERKWKERELEVQSA